MVAGSPGRCAWTALSEGSSPPARAARASAPSSASVKTGALCFIDFPHESRSRRLVCLESILGLPFKRSGPVSGFPLPVSTRTSFCGNDGLASPCDPAQAAAARRGHIGLGYRQSPTASIEKGAS